MQPWREDLEQTIAENEAAEDTADPDAEPSGATHQRFVGWDDADAEHRPLGHTAEASYVSEDDEGNAQPR